MELLNELMAQVPAWLSAIALLVSGAAAIAALTPTPKDDAILAAIRKVIDVLALNVGGAKNQQK